MSLILEALRKSEAERRRGELPGLHVELPPTQAVPAGRARWLWVALALGFIATAVLLWGIRGAWRPAPTPALGADADLATAPAVQPDGGADAAAPPATTGSAADVSRIPEPSVQPAVEPVTVAAAPTMRSPAPAIRTESPASAEDPSPSPRSPQPAVATAAPPVPADASAPSAANTDRVDSGAPMPIALADLGPDERRALPALKISMHMWNEAPAQRFVIIDGNRVTEGSRIGEAVVDRITPDGVLLAWQGRQLRLPIR